jgi:hypothetical protein
VGDLLDSVCLVLLGILPADPLHRPTWPSPQEPRRISHGEFAYSVVVYNPVSLSLLGSPVEVIVTHPMVTSRDDPTCWLTSSLVHKLAQQPSSTAPSTMLNGDVMQRVNGQEEDEVRVQIPNWVLPVSTPKQY